MLGSPGNQIVESAKRTAELRIPLAISRPFHGLRLIFTFDPTDESVGYFHLVRFTDEIARLLGQSEFNAKGQAKVEL